MRAARHVLRSAGLVGRIASTIFEALGEMIVGVGCTWIAVEYAAPLLSAAQTHAVLGLFAGFVLFYAAQVPLSAKDLLPSLRWISLFLTNAACLGAHFYWLAAPRPRQTWGAAADRAVQFTE